MEVPEGPDTWPEASTVDGESSTNDTVFILANGTSGVRIDPATYPSLVDGLYAVCAWLAFLPPRAYRGWLERSAA